jgi:O-antigen/teichoic acid export membrane protein
VIVVLASLGFGLEWIISWMILVDLSFAIGTICLLIRQEGFPTLNFIGIKKFVLFSIPSVPAGLMMWVLASSDRFFITHFLDLTQTAIYSCSYLLAGMIGLFYTPIVYVLFPTISKAWEQNRKDDVKSYLEYSTKLFLLLSIPAAVGLTLLSQPILKIITTSQYLAGWQLILLVSIGTIFFGLYQINVFLIYLAKKTKLIPLAAGMATLVNVGINYALVPKIGILGGAISTVAAYFILASIIFVWTKKIIVYNINFVFLGKVVFASVPMGLFLYYFKVNSALGILLAVIGGTAIFAISIFLLRTFSVQDKQLIKQTLTGLISRLH